MAGIIVRIRKGSCVLFLSVNKIDLSAFDPFLMDCSMLLLRWPMLAQANRASTLFCFVLKRGIFFAPIKRR
jgi:hypothetical protein